MIKIWHNPRCSKSREAKAILEDANVEFEIFEYLKEPFRKDDIKDIIKKLNITDVKDMLRKKEAEYKDNNIENKSLDEILEILVSMPKLIERPIIIKDNKAVIARPMENLINFLDNKS